MQARNYWLNELTDYSEDDYYLPQGFISKRSFSVSDRGPGSLWNFRVNVTNLIGASVLLEDGLGGIRGWRFSILVKAYFYNKNYDIKIITQLLRQNKIFINMFRVEFECF